MPPLLQQPHRLCASGSPGNTGFFSQPLVAANAVPKRRRVYMFEFLRWMREETHSNELKDLHKECKKIINT
jgi:hypothetical protein